MTTEKPEGVSPVPSKYPVSEPEETIRPIDEKVAEVAVPIGAGRGPVVKPQREMETVELESGSLKTEEITSKMVEQAGEAKARMIAVVKEVVEKVLEDIFSFDTSLDPFLGSDLNSQLEGMSSDSLRELYNKLLNYKKYEENESIIIEIARLCARTNGIATAQYIQNFHIDNQEILIEIATICAQQAKARMIAVVKEVVEKVLEDIFSYKPMLDPLLGDRLDELLEKMSSDSLLKIYNKLFKFERIKRDESIIIEIAKICAQVNYEFMLMKIKTFGINDKMALIEIAKLCARQDGFKTAAWIHNFKIEDQRALIEIAKLCAQRDDWGVARCLDNFGITDQKALIEIAMLCAQHDAESTVLYLDKFKITDTRSLIKIAKLCARQNGMATATHIKKFDIHDQEILIEIAMLCAQQNGTGTASSIDNFHIENHEALATIAVYCVLRRTDYFKRSLKLEDLNCFQKFPPEVIERMTSFCKEAVSPEFLHTISREQDWSFISEETSAINKQMLFSLFFACKVLDKMEALRNPSVRQMVEWLNEFRISFLKPFILRCLIEVIVDKKDKEFGDFIKSCEKIHIKPSAQPQARLVLLTIFAAKNVNKDLKVRIAREFLEKLSKRSSFLLAGSKIGLFMEFVRFVNESVDPEEQEVVYKTFVDYKDRSVFSQKMFIFQAAEAFGIDLRDRKSEEIRGLVLQHMDFPKKFIEIYETLRKKAALFIYVKKMNELREPERSQVLGNLHSLLQEIGEGSYVENRYARSPQLKKMEEACSQEKRQLWDKLLEKWKKPSKMSVEECLAPQATGTSGHMVGESAFSRYIVENTDDCWDLFLCGTEVEGSCMSVAGDPKNNKHLLGYVVDGKIRMIAVKNERGQIVARSIIKLLWDDSTKMPILFAERIYSNDPQFKPVVEKMIQSEAKRLGIELVSEKTALGRKIQSYTNRSGFEYEDSPHDMQRV